MHTKIMTIGILTMLAFVALSPMPAFAHENHEHARQEAIERFRQAKEERPGRQSRFEYRQEMLLRAIDSLVKHAELLLERVGNLPAIQEDTKTSIQKEIRADIAFLQQFKEKLLAAKTEEELRALAKELKEHRADVMQKKVRKLILLAHVGIYESRIVHTATARTNRIAEKLDEFEELGKEVSALEKLLTQAKNTIAEASDTLELVKQDVVENDIDQAALKEMHKALKSIRDNIKSAYSIFRDIANQAAEL